MTIPTRINYWLNFYRAMRDLLAQKVKPIDTPWGFKFCGNENMAKGLFEPQETKVIRDLIKKSDVLINIGANVGYYCCHALSLGKTVIAIEPIFQNIFFLIKNIYINGWQKKAEIFPLALGRSTDILPIWGGGTGASLLRGWAGIHDSYVSLVPVLSLDQIAYYRTIGKKLLIVADIEGSEFAMLQGAKKMLQRKQKPVWVMEVSQKEHQPKTRLENPYFKPTFQLFFQNGYSVASIQNPSKIMLPQDIRKICRGDQLSPGHNFIFFKK